VVSGIEKADDADADADADANAEAAKQREGQGAMEAAAVRYSLSLIAVYSSILFGSGTRKLLRVSLVGRWGG
jgi:hypothetical protein